jgi:hypothetical protein
MRPVGKWVLILGVATFVFSAGFFAVANLFGDSAIVRSIWDSIPDTAGLFNYFGYWCIGPVLMPVGGILYCAAKPICTIERKAEDKPR